MLKRSALTSVGLRLASSLAKIREEFADIACQELRFPIRDIREELDQTINALRSFGDLSELVTGRRTRVDSGKSVAILLPYNVAAEAISIVATSVVAGGSTAIRFSSRAPNVSRLCRKVLETFGDRVAIHDAPAQDFLNRVMGNPHYPVVIAYGGEDLGYTLLRKRTGQHIIFEGPGKDAFVVLEGSDLNHVVTTLRRSAFARSGQECISTERVIVEQGLYPELVARLEQLAGSIRVGPASDLETEVSELAGDSLPRIIREQIHDAVRHGARIVAGGGINGRIVEPTVLSGVPTESMLWKNETFGPVIAVRPARNRHDAARQALDSRYGLHAIVTGNRAKEFASALTNAPLKLLDSGLGIGRVGTATVGEQISLAGDVNLPFGGWGISGWVRSSDGELHQGPRRLIHEITVPA